MLVISSMALKIQNQNEQSNKEQKVNKQISLFDKIMNYVQQENIHTQIRRPKIIVFGEPKTGKSSIIERIIGIQFLPKIQNKMTQRPIQIKMTQDQKLKYNSQIKLVAKFEEIKEKQFYDFKSIKQIIEKMIQQSDQKSTIPITLNLYLPKCLNLTIVEINCLINSQEQNNQNIDNLLRDQNNVILAVISAKTNLQKSKTLNATKKINSNGDRTIFCLTYLDQIENQVLLLNLFENQFKIFNQFGFFGIVNANKRSLNHQTYSNRSNYFQHKNRYYNKKNVMSQSYHSNLNFISQINQYQDRFFRNRVFLNNSHNLGIYSLLNFLNYNLKRKIWKQAQKILVQIKVMKNQLLFEMNKKNKMIEIVIIQNKTKLQHLCQQFIFHYKQMIHGRQQCFIDEISHGNILSQMSLKLKFIFKQEFQMTIKSFLKDDDTLQQLKQSIDKANQGNTLKSLRVFINRLKKRFQNYFKEITQLYIKICQKVLEKLHCKSTSLKEVITSKINEILNKLSIQEMLEINKKIENEYYKFQEEYQFLDMSIQKSQTMKPQFAKKYPWTNYQLDYFEVCYKKIIKILEYYFEAKIDQQICWVAFKQIQFWIRQLQNQDYVFAQECYQKEIKKHEFQMNIFKIDLQRLSQNYEFIKVIQRQLGNIQFGKLNFRLRSITNNSISFVKKLTQNQKGQQEILYEVQTSKHQNLKNKENFITQIQQIQSQNKTAASTFCNQIINKPITKQQYQENKQLQQKFQQKAKEQQDSIQNVVLQLGKYLKNYGQQVIFQKQSSLRSALSIKALATGLMMDRVKVTQVIQDNQSEWKFEDIISCQQKSFQFDKFYKRKISKQTGIQFDDIVIHKITNCCIKIQCSTSDKNGALRAAANNKKLKLHSFFRFYGLSSQDFDPKGNIEFFQTQTDIQYRGSLPYYQPVKCKRYGLKVSGKYDKGDDTWLKMQNVPNQWAVAFHGVRKQGEQMKKCLKSIMEGIEKGKMLQPGYGQPYCRQMCVNKPEQVGQGIYCTPHIQQTFPYTIKNKILKKNGKIQQYRLIFQCRVRPSSIKVCSTNQYWVINKSQDIRPYGIILLKEQNYNNYPSIQQQFGKKFKWSDYERQLGGKSSKSNNNNQRGFFSSLFSLFGL